MSRGIVIEGVTISGAVVASFTLPHGGDPSGELSARGWSMTGVMSAFTPVGTRGVTIRLAVVASLDAARPHETWFPSVLGEQLPDGVVPVRVQRLAAYAVVARDGATLLTRLSSQVRGAGLRWTLPGGGIDPGEDPSVGLRREVWEETGQHLGEIQFLDVVTSHWVGQAPDGTWEDYQVVRLVYAATLPEPGPLIIHDIGGTTCEAAWVDAETPDAPQRAALLLGPRWANWRQAAAEREQPARRAPR